MTTLFFVCSEGQRNRKRGCYAATRNLESAIDRARKLAKRLKRRMFVVVTKTNET